MFRNAIAGLAAGIALCAEPALACIGLPPDVARRDSEAVVVGRVVQINGLRSGKQIARIRVVSSIRGKLRSRDFDYRWDPASTCAWMNKPVRLGEEAIFYVDLTYGFHVAWVSRITQASVGQRR